MKSILVLFAISLMISMGLPSINDTKEELNTRSNITLTEKEINVDAQIALLLDTSGSMEGLIEQAKSQLWNIVNELSEAKKQDEPVRFQIALYEYGNDNISSSDSYVRQIADFTSDIDLISQKLFALTTNGGSEYCGAVIGKSLTQLHWSTLANLRTIYIAGDESFAQGHIPYKAVCASANDHNIIVNTIFCGPVNQGIELQWRKGARLAGGNYFNIDQNQTTRYYDTPYDDEISALNENLNDTYIHYGQKGKDYLDNQRKQDFNANSYGSSNAASRSVFKSNKQYNNAKWDLVDAYEKDKKVIKEATDLPSAYKNLSKTQLEKEVNKISKHRKSIQFQIGDLAIKRKSYIAEQKKADGKVSSLDESINSSIRDQAIKAGLTYESINKERASLIDFKGFSNATIEVEKYRQKRLIGSDEFISMSKEANTIILDTRSKKAYDERHVNNAIHLNFSDFTEAKLNALIPDKNTRILIYCNNNFISESPAIVLKAPALALNIPTFINLHGYGYKNIYELKSLLLDNESVLKMSSTQK